jgi:hypothetical protein
LKATNVKSFKNSIKNNHMATFKVAHVKEQGQDMIIVFVSDSVGRMPTDEQNKLRSRLEACAHSAGLRGSAVLVWDAGGGRIGFLSPSPWVSFFKSIQPYRLYQSINRELTCGD